MKKSISVSLIIFAVLIVGYLIYLTFPKQAPSSIPLPLQNNGQTIVDVTLTVGAPFSSSSVTVTSAGEVIYEEVSPDTGIDRRTETQKITPGQFTELAKMINENKFWSFKKEYNDTSLADGITYTVSVRSIPSNVDPTLAFPGTYSVSCYAECPNEVIQIRNKIKELWGKPMLELGV